MSTEYKLPYTASEIHNRLSKIDSLISVSDIVDNLITDDANKPLSASQGLAIKALIDALQNILESKLDSAHNTDETAHNDIRELLNSTTTTANNALPKSGDTMTGALVAQTNANYTIRQVRNVIFVPEGEDLPSGSNGDICIVYVP